MFTLVNFVVSIVLGIIAGIVPVLAILSSIWSLVTLLPSVAVGIRRMHDIGKVGWWILAPLYNIYLAAQPTLNEGNPYSQKA